VVRFRTAGRSVAGRGRSGRSWAGGWGLGQGSGGGCWVGSTPRQGDLTRVHGRRQALREKGWTQGWNNTETAQGSAQHPDTQLGCRAWPGRSRGDGAGGTRSTLLGNRAAVRRGVPCPCPPPPAAPRVSGSTEPSSPRAPRAGLSVSSGWPRV